MEFIVALLFIAAVFGLPIFLINCWIKGYKEEKARHELSEDKNLVDGDSVKEAIKNSITQIVRHPGIFK